MDSKRPHASGAGSRVLFGSNASETSTALTQTPTVIDHVIVIGRGIGSLHMVSVSPEHPDHEPKIFDSHKQARGYASGLRLCHRWQIVDETGEAK